MAKFLEKPAEGGDTGARPDHDDRRRELIGKPERLVLATEHGNLKHYQVLKLKATEREAKAIFLHFLRIGTILMSA